MVACPHGRMRSRLFDKFRDPGLAGFDKEEIDGIFEQFLNGPVVLRGEHFQLPSDFGVEVSADEPLAHSGGPEEFLARLLAG